MEEVPEDLSESLFSHSRKLEKSTIRNIEPQHTGNVINYYK